MATNPFTTGYAPANTQAKKKQKVSLLILVIVYLFTFIGFTLLVVSQATTSWTVVDNFKDFVYPDEYQGLWQICLDKEMFVCTARDGQSWIYIVRAVDLLAFLVLAVVMVIFIISHINKNVRPRLATGFLMVATMLVLVGMMVYTAKAPLPRTVTKARNPYVTREFKVRFGYSYMLGWAGILLTFMAGITALLLR